MSKVVPVVGGVVAAGFDAAMTQLIGRAADRLFRPKPDDEPPPAPQIRPPEPLLTHSNPGRADSSDLLRRLSQ